MPSAPTPQPAFRRIALIGKFQSPEVAESLHALAEFLRSRGCDVMVWLEDGRVRACGRPDEVLTETSRPDPAWSTR